MYFPLERFVKGVNRLWRWAVCGLIAVAAGACQAPGQSAPVIAGLPSEIPGRSTPALAALFVPRTAPPGCYDLLITSAPIDRVLMFFEARGAHPAGSWTIGEEDALSVFGNAGAYDRSRLARLYGGRRVQVARGPLQQDGHVTTSLTLISPFPDAALERLVQGTLTIVFRVDRLH
jgi:hypothetical protein